MQKLNLENPVQEMLDAFASYPVDRIRIDFDNDFTFTYFLRKGDNDDGSAEVELEDLDLHSQHREKFRRSNAEFQDYFDEDPLTLQPLVEAVWQHVMLRQFPGWEVGDGTCGEIVIDPRNGRISIDLMLRIVDSYDLE